MAAAAVRVAHALRQKINRIMNVRLIYADEAMPNNARLPLLNERLLARHLPVVSRFGELSDDAFVSPGVIACLAECSTPTLGRRVAAGLLPAPRRIAGSSRIRVGDYRKVLAVRNDSVRGRRKVNPEPALAIAPGALGVEAGALNRRSAKRTFPRPRGRPDLQSSRRLLDVEHATVVNEAYSALLLDLTLVLSFGALVLSASSLLRAAIP